MAAVTIVTNPYNPYSHRSHIWKTWNQKPHYGLNVVFIIHIIQIICSSGFDPDYVGKPQIIQTETTFNPHFIKAA